MEFLRSLFTAPLSFEAFVEAVNKAGFKLADLSTGNYVDKGKYDKVSNELSEAKTTISTLTSEAEELRTKGASADEWKDKFEKLEKEHKEKAEKAEAERIEAEKAAAIDGRFAAATGDKKFSHDAIRADYRRKFGEALESKDYEGKSDAEIFHALTKDDGSAFSNVTAFRLPGGAEKGAGGEIDEAAARAVMGLPPAKN